MAKELESYQRRLIIVCSDDGSNEDVIFTTDTEVRAADYCGPDQTVSFDGIIDADLPSMFPEESSLHRSW